MAVVPLIESQVRISMAGMVGMDVAACLPILSACGLDGDVAALFLTFWEQGRLMANRDMKEDSE